MTSTLIVVGVLVALVVLLCLGGFVLLVGLVVARRLRKPDAEPTAAPTAAEIKAAGVDVTDGIDANEWAIIRGMLTRHKQTKLEQSVAVDLVNAAQVALRQSLDETGKPVK